MLSPGRDGVLGILKQCTSPAAEQNTRSVKVPPTSVPIKVRDPANVLSFPVCSERLAPGRPPVYQASRSVTVPRHRQPDVLPRRPALISSSEQPAPLQFRYYHVDKILDPARQMRGNDVEPIGRLGLDPRLHCI